MNLHKLLPDKIQWLLLGASLATVALIGFGNYQIGWQISFSIFYLVPIYICVHNIGRWAGLLLSVVCGSTWIVIERNSNPLYSDLRNPLYTDPFFCYWNGLALLGFFLIFTLLIASVEASLKREKQINQNLENLLTIAPYDQDKGWGISSQPPPSGLLSDEPVPGVPTPPGQQGGA